MPILMYFQTKPPFPLFPRFHFYFWIFNPSKTRQISLMQANLSRQRAECINAIGLCFAPCTCWPTRPEFVFENQNAKSFNFGCHLMPYSPCLLAQRSLLSGALSCLTPFLASQLISSQPRTAKCVSRQQKDANSFFEMNPFWKTEATGKGVVSHQGNCYDVIYDEFGGPKNMGQLLVRPGYLRLSCESCESCICSSWMFATQLKGYGLWNCWRPRGPQGASALTSWDGDNL